MAPPERPVPMEARVDGAMGQQMRNKPSQFLHADGDEKRRFNHAASNKLLCSLCWRRPRPAPRESERANRRSTLGIPKSAPEHRLHPPRRFIARMFGQLPTVLALHPANQAVQIKPGLRPRLRALKQAAKPLIQFRQLRRPRQRRSRPFGYGVANPPPLNSRKHINRTLPTTVVLNLRSPAAYALRDVFCLASI